MGILEKGFQVANPLYGIGKHLAGSGALDPNITTMDVGGGPARGLSEDVVSALSSFITGAPARTGSIMDRLNQIIAGEDISGQEQALESIIQSSIGRGAADIRERFGAGGMGTPAAVAESLFRAESAPRSALAIGELRRARRGQQLQGILPVLQALTSLSSLGIPQARVDTIVGESDVNQILGLLQGLANIGGSIASVA